MAVTLKGENTRPHNPATSPGACSLSVRTKNETLKSYLHTRVPATLLITAKRWE